MGSQFKKRVLLALAWAGSLIGGGLIVLMLTWALAWLMDTPGRAVPASPGSEEGTAEQSNQAQANTPDNICEALKSDFNTLMRNMDSCTEDDDCRLVENTRGMMDLGGSDRFWCNIPTHKNSYEMVKNAVDNWAGCSRIRSACTFRPNARHGTGGIAVCKDSVCSFEPLGRISLEELQEQAKSDNTEQQ